MKICPKCGHHEAEYWRASRYRPLCSQTRADTIEWNDPELYKKIMEVNPNPYFDGTFMYHLTKKGWIERIEKYYYDYMKWGQEPQEKVDHSNLALMPKLAEYMTNTDRKGES